MTGALCKAVLARAEAAPAATALVDAVRTVSYGELWERVRGVRRLLEDSGVPLGSLVGIDIADRGAVPAAALGVMLHGCAYVPLDPAYPAARLEFIQEDAGLVGTLTGRGRGEMTYRPGAAARAAAVDVPDPAYLIYTSGTTGAPKGVLVRQHQVADMLASTTPLLGATAADAWSVFHSFNFDFSVWELFGPLVTGGRAVLLSDAEKVDGTLLSRRLRETGVTMLSMVPTAFKYLLGDGSAADLPDLRWIVFGGESVDVPRALEWLGDSRSTRVMNMYGLTECTVHATQLVLSSRTPASRRGATPIGRPLPHLHIDVVDAELRSLAPHEIGELVVSGTSVAGGYWRRPELTSTRFVLRDGAWTYRTGDLGYRDEDGLLHHAGRADDQVQVRGHRVEPAEIAAAAQEHPAVAEAVVVPELNPAGEVALACHYRSREELPPTELRAWLAGRLPAHLLPARVQLHDAFPLTPEGKVDRVEIASVRG